MLKAVLVHLTGSACDEAVLTTAANLAKPSSAHLDCLHIRPALGTLAVAAARMSTGDDNPAFSEHFEALRKAAKESAHRAHQAFTAFCKREGIPHAAVQPGPGGVTATWHDKLGNKLATLKSELRFRDLVVVAGGAMSGDRLSTQELGDLVLGAGRPVLLAAETPSAKPIRTIAIAWKDTAEAARAITAAMPLLSSAERIVVLSANEENKKAMECIDCSDSVVGHLRWHGFRAEGRYVIPAGRSIPDSILETAGEIGADLLVMGAYGRSRLSETIFGGFTQRVLLGSDLPVFLFH